MKRNDWIMLVAILAAAALLTVAGSLKQKEQTGAWAVVTVKGKEYGRYKLSEHRTIGILGPLGTNYLVIRDGRAWMVEAVCPDGYCIKQGEINRTGQRIICLPNGIVVELAGGEESMLDATVY